MWVSPVHGHTQVVAPQDPPLYTHLDPVICPPRSAVTWGFFKLILHGHIQAAARQDLRDTDTLTLAIACQDPP